jgi:hypothetical protein
MSWPNPLWLQTLRTGNDAPLTWLAPDDRGLTPAHPDFDDWLPVAAGPAVAGGRHDDPRQSYFWLRRADPSQLWLGFHEHCPPWLFVEAGTTPETITSVLSVTQPGPGLPRTQRFRCFAGFVSEMAVIENRLVLSANMNSFPLRLGTAATEAVPDAERLVTITSIFQARYSASRLTIHGLADILPAARLLVADVAYPPSPHASAIACCNAARKRSLPLDLPLDVAAELSQLPIRSEDECLAEIESGEEPGLFLFASALMRYDEPERIEALASRFEGKSELLHRSAAGVRQLLLHGR